MNFKGFSPAKNCVRPESKMDSITTAWKVSKYRVISGPYFPAFGVNTETYVFALRIQSECGKIRTRNNSVFWHFSWSALLCLINPNFIQKNQKKAMSQSWESGVRYGRTNGRTKLSLQDPLAEPMVQKVTRAHVFLLLILHNFLKKLFRRTPTKFSH